MLIKILKQYRLQIVAGFIVVGLFALGFIFGKYAKAAPSLEVIEAEQRKHISPVVVSNVEITTSETVEAAEPEKIAEPEKVKQIKVRATAYCSCEKCCGKWAKNRPLDDNGNPIVYTASGTVAKAGRTIAVDPSVIPYGTEVVINGRTYIAEDSGGVVKGNRIDIYFEDHEKAQNFGVKYLTATINERGAE